MTGGYLGLDMGGTRSRWVWLDAAGHEVARGEAPGANTHLFNPEARRAFVAALSAIRAGLPGPVLALHGGMTGFGPDLLDEVRAVVSEVLGVPGPRVTATNDIELAALAAFPPGAGHVVAVGTGSVGISIAADGSATRIGGRGTLIDDAGSGAWIALRALAALWRLIDEDGDAARAPWLADEIFAAVGGPDWGATRAFVYAGDRGRIATLAEAVGRAADRGCALAAGVLEDAGDEIARLGAILIARCGPLPVAFVGGVVAQSPRIRGHVAGRLAARAPGSAAVFPRTDPALTAARIAAGPEAARLR
jgi:N-acetylglucosamine kinase-like BadF-type ATPase